MLRMRMAILTDRLTFDAPKRTPEGYMAVRAKSARVGIQEYLGREVDPTGTKFRPNDVVSVYRPEDEVMSEKSVRSFIMKPITNDHPTEAVNADNHSRLSKGVVAKAMRDGDHLAFDLVFFDAATIADIDAGKRELSNGYSVDLSIEDGVTPDGKAYQAIQRNIVGNHVALVDKGRAGPDCAIGICDAITVEDFRTIVRDNVIGDDKPMKTILVDGHSVEVSDAAEIAIAGLNAKLTAATADITRLTADKAAADTQIATLTTKSATADAEIVTLKKQIEDGKITPAMLRDAAAKFAKTVEIGKALGVTVTDAMDEAAIQKAAVVAKLGKLADGWTDAQIATSFATLAAAVPDTFAEALKTTDGKTVDLADQHKAYDASVANLNAWRDAKTA